MLPTRTSCTPRYPKPTARPVAVRQQTASARRGAESEGGPRGECQGVGGGCREHHNQHARAQAPAPCTGPWLSQRRQPAHPLSAVLRVLSRRPKDQNKIFGGTCINLNKLCRYHAFLEMEALEQLSRGELQALAKTHGIKANKKNADLIAELRALAAEQHRPEDPEKAAGCEDSKPPRMSVGRKRKSVAAPAQECADTEEMAWATAVGGDSSTCAGAGGYAGMSRAAIQALAKERGFKANAKTADLIQMLQDADPTETIPEPKPAAPAAALAAPAGRKSVSAAGRKSVAAAGRKSLARPRKSTASSKSANGSQPERIAEDPAPAPEQGLAAADAVHEETTAAGCEAAMDDAPAPTKSTSAVGSRRSAEGQTTSESTTKRQSSAAMRQVNKFSKSVHSGSLRNYSRVLTFESFTQSLAVPTSTADVQADGAVGRRSLSVGILKKSVKGT